MNGRKSPIVWSGLAGGNKAAISERARNPAAVWATDELMAKLTRQAQEHAHALGIDGNANALHTAAVYCKTAEKQIKSLNQIQRLAVG